MACTGLQRHSILSFPHAWKLKSSAGNLGIPFDSLLYSEVRICSHGTATEKHGLTQVLQTKNHLQWYVCRCVSVLQKSGLWRNTRECYCDAFEPYTSLGKLPCPAPGSL